MTTSKNSALWGPISLTLLLLPLGLIAMIWPELIAARFRPATGVTPEVSMMAAAAIVRSVALPLVLIPILSLLSSHLGERHQRLLGWLVATAAVVAYISMQSPLWNWTVDDAAITFAYSENLVRGYGLVLHPAQHPEEAYSNTLWMLMLAFARWIGFRLDVASKILGAAFGAGTVLIAVRACIHLQTKTLSYASILTAVTICLGAPFIIWSSSGLEHSLQAFLLISIAALPLLGRRTIWPSAICLGALMLLRPETPLIVAATICVYVVDRFSTGRTALVQLWPLVAVPFLVGAALLIFRLYYFGVPFPNPYYAKASTATFLRLINPVGVGWGYVIDWLASSGAYLLLPAIVLTASLRAHLSIRLASSLIVAQIAFVLYAGGDWMGQFRFISPILPLISLVIAVAVGEVNSHFSAFRSNFATSVILIFLCVGTISSLHNFRAAPTTPTSTVTAIGLEFVKLAARLGVEHPTLAHHDAGGTSWGAEIDLIDLGGLGNRAIAQHMHDPEFIRRYLFVERRPTFIFGVATLFAAGTTKFYTMSEFTQQYVQLKFPDLPFMKADLCYIRRDLIKSAPGISVDEENGQAVSVIVRQSH